MRPKNFTILWEIITYTLQLLAKDKKSLVILLLMPFILIAALGFSLSGIFTENDFTFEKAKIAIVDQDQTMASRLLLENGFHNIEIMKIIDSKELNKEEAEKQFANRNLDGILYIHKGYENQFINGKKDELLLKMNPVKSIQTDIIKQMLSQYHILGKMVVDSVNGGREMANFPSMTTFLTSQAMKLEVKSGGTEQKSVNSFQYYAIGMGVMYGLFTVLTGVGFILNEQKQHTLDRIRMMPFSTSIFYIGKSLAFTLIGILQLLILFISTHFVFGVEYGGHPFYLFAVTVLYSLAGSGLMILLISLIKDQNTLSTVFGLGVPVMAALGGSMIPVEQFPWFIEPISKILPNRNAMEAFFHVMLNRPEQAYPSMLYLFGFAIATSFVGVYFISRKGMMAR
ncbi:ABC transporter permease [Tepidibacillus marianensis]|uniref:ABC transporter permease n=1 Tax=Tepidibacillus marianensis TaxID=3131995 RepID=UPI0030CE4BA2